MSIEKNVQVVKDFFAAIGSYNEHDLLALVTEDIEWIIPGDGWPLAGTHRGHAELAAVRNFARAWTMELKDRKIRVNSMSPGPTDTPALATTTGLTAEQAEQAAAQFATQIPMGRRGMPEEIAAAVVFLASDESSYITGVDLAVDGGMAQV